MTLGSAQPLTVPGAFPGGKDSRCVRLTNLPPSCAVVIRSENLNFLESFGPLQACKGTALPYPLDLNGPQTEQKLTYTISVKKSNRFPNLSIWYIIIFVVVAMQIGLYAISITINIARISKPVRH